MLSECFSKLIHPPVTTHSRILINDTLAYPAITICRSPPYKTSVLKKYGLGENIRWTSEWENFPHDQYTLQNFWDEASYAMRDTIPFYAMGGRKENLSVESSTYFLSGKCHTFKSLARINSTGKNSGYAFLLRHSCWNCNETDVGWNVYIHEASEVWTENGKEATGRVESVFVETQEVLHIKVSVQEFHRLHQPPEYPCNTNYSYSVSLCQESCHWNSMVRTIGCSAPYLRGIDMPHCNDSESHKALMTAYLTSTCENPCCNCIQPCHTVHFTASIVNRHLQTNLTYSTVFIYFTNKMVSIVEEHYTYNWSNFVADLGGSLGFLLGLSVLGVIGIIERLVEISIKCANMSQDLAPEGLIEDKETWRMAKDKNHSIKNTDIGNRNYEIGGVAYKY
ncbi:acid-sensing ion channel 1 [Anabrus simplex]|uniref:acid-sensing ion channel 1 n=1 Tax=Anabrus simplex TaxID=316456 RepID=UPI0035A3BB23